MDQKLTVAKIYEYVTKKELNKAEAIKLLNYFIEKSEIIDDRINSLRAFELLNLNNKEAYGILENSLLSDENPEVRKTAVKVLIKIFPIKSKALLKWASNHDNQLSL
jgi:HEAT repeat protein